MEASRKHLTRVSVLIPLVLLLFWGMKSSCVFCTQLLAGQRRLIFENELYVAMESRRKIAARHYLLLPKRHISQREGIHDQKMIRDLCDVAQTLCEPRELHIHPPPFNSVDHFHMHCFQGEFNNAYHAFIHKYFTIRINDSP